jgi:GDP-mannose transporter
MQRLDPTELDRNPVTIVLTLLTYSVCSATLLLCNKIAISELPVPAVISFTQISAAAVFVLGLSCCGVAVDALTVDKCVAYSPYVVAFVAAIYANMQALARSNVETVVVFRACTPLAVSVVEYVFQGRAWPSARSCVALAGVACGALLYVATDAQRVADGWACYKWAIVYFLLITFETTLGKSWTASVRMDTVWGPVLYCNVLAALPMFLLGYVHGDYAKLDVMVAEMPAGAAMVILFTCVTGVLIGYTGWLSRGMVDASSFSLLGVVNKFLTVGLNCLLWDKHASPVGLLAVALCLVSGTFVEQAPRRDEVVTAAATAAAAASGGKEGDNGSGPDGVPLLPSRKQTA